METTRLCPECQTPLPADAPAGLCPRCLLQQGALRDSASAPTEPPRRAKGPPVAPPLADVAARFPQFEVRKLIGVGGMGAVYEVRQLQLDRIVALKVMLPEVSDDPKFAERFSREARALAKLNHPNIVAVYDFGQAGDWFYFVMEFVDGANLRQTMRAGRLTAAQALAIVPKLCDALQFAHDEGIMHRDIKPENILLDKKGRVKIADFGLAKLLGAEPDDHSITVTGVGMGTPRYMAPEQLENAKSVDHRADIYSLGVVFYEMLTGELPLGRFDPPSARVQVDVRLDEIVLKALEKSPQRRYQQASEVKSQVENVASSPPIAPIVPTASPIPAPAGQENPVVAFTRFATTPQPGYLRQVGIPSLILTAVWMVVNFVVMFVVPQANQAVRTLVLGAGLLGIPLGLLILSLRWAVRRGRQPALPVDSSPANPAAKPSQRNLLSAALAVLCLFGFFFGFAFNAKRTATEAGPVEILTIGALDPLYIKESGPSGFRSSLNFFSWSSFAVMVAGVSLSALFRLGKEDQGKAPRDSAWWRTWWKQVGIWGGLVLIACIVRTALNPEKVLQPPGDRTVASRFAQLFNSGPEIRVDRSQLPATATPGRRDFAFTFNAPSNHVLNVWLEFWKDGKLEIPTSFSESYLPARGDSVRGGLHLITQDGDMAGVGSAGQMRFDWALSRHARVVSDISKLDSKSTSSSGRWRTNVFKELSTRGSSSAQVSWDDQSAPTVWRPKPGEVTTVLAWTAHAGKSVSSSDLKWTEEGLAKGTPMVAILLRVRFDPVTPGELSVAPMTKKATINAKNRGSLGGTERRPLDADPAKPPAAASALTQPFMIGLSGPELTTEAITKLKLSKLQTDEINRIVVTYHRDYLALQRRHSKVGKDAAGRILVTIEPFYDECLALAQRLQTELGGIVDPALLPVVRNGELPFQIFNWGGACNETITLWKDGEKYFVEEKLTAAPGHPRDPFTCNISGPKLEEIPPQFRIYWREDGAKPELPTKPIEPQIPRQGTFNIQQERSQLPATATPGRQDYAFKFSGPKDHTLNVWMEVWQEGKMEWVSNFDFEAKPQAGEPLAAGLTLTAIGGDAASKESKGKTRLHWAMSCSGSEGKIQTANALIPDLSAGMGATYSTWDRQLKPLNPRSGETVTVLGITGYKLSNFRSAMTGLTEADLLKRGPNAAVLVRARFSPARPGQLSDAVGLDTKVSDQAFARRTFAQFEISKQLGVDLSNCQTRTEAHAALVAAASTPDGSARAAQMVDELGSDGIGYADHFKMVAEPLLAMWWKLRKKEPTTAEEVVTLLENFITALNGPGSHSVWWNHGEPITKWAEGPSLNDSFAKKLKLTKLQVDEVNKLFKKYADEAKALSRRHTKVTKNDQGHVIINVEPYSNECLELARKMVAELGGIVTQDIVPAVKVGALPTAIFGNAGECRETTVLKKDAKGVYVIEISRSDWVNAHGAGAGNSTTSWGSQDIDLAFGSYKMYWSGE